MAQGPHVQVRGARQLRASLRKADHDMGDLKDVHKRVGSIVAEAGASRAPVRSGALARSIRAGALQTGAVVRAGSAAVPYAGAIHWGWPKRNISANPFLSEAATSTEGTWLAVYTSEVDRILNRIKGA